MVRSLIAEIVGKEAVTGVDPMTAIAEGAAIAAAILTGEAPDNDFFVATEHALGTYVHNEGGPRTFTTIIPRNHKLPAQATDSFVPVGDLQEELLMEVVEGEPGTTEINPENVVLKAWSIPLDTTRQTLQEKAVDVTYAYDVDGILQVTVVDQMTGGVMLQDDVSFGFSQDKRALVQMAQRAQAAVDGGAVVAANVPVVQDPRTADVLQKARNKVIPFLDDSEAESLRALVAEVESGDSAALQPYSYLF
jgi:molecular chaperone DnaK (HSP70)